MRRPQPTTAIPVFATILLALAGGAGTVRAQATTSTTSLTTTTLSGATSTSTTSSTSTTTVPPALRCKDRLLNRGKKLTRRLTKCEVRAVRRARKSKPFDAAACATKALERYDLATSGSTKFARGCLPCTLDAVTPVRAGMVALAADVDTRIECAPAVPIAERARCEIKLRKAVASYEAGLMVCRKEAARTAYEGGVPAESACVATARTDFDAKVARLSCPACIDTDRIAGAAFERTDDLIGLAHCPCRFGDASVCGECGACDVAEGCVPANEDRSCGRDGCTQQTCVAGTCTSGETVACSDGDVCTVDVCLEAENPGCHGADCCDHQPLCDADALGACVIECTCAPAVGCSCRCTPGCDYPGCVIFSDP